MAERELDGRVALVTGAARNIGRAIALALAEAGADVAVNTLSSRDEAEETARLVRDQGVRALVLVGDATDPKAVEEMVSRAAAELGGVDILVNNAALRREGKLEDVGIEDWRQIIATMLDAPFLMSKACLPHLRRGGQGRIVNIGGMTGHTGAPERVHVATAKAGLAGLTRALAHDLAADGVTVNCVVPGLIDTVRGRTNALNPAHHANRKLLLGRRGRPEEVAGMVRYLCGAEAAYVTGQSIHVNGGAFMA